MATLPTLNGREIIKIFAKDGWQIVRQRGSHMILVKEGQMATLFQLTQRWVIGLCARDC